MNIHGESTDNNNKKNNSNNDNNYNNNNNTFITFIVDAKIYPTNNLASIFLLYMFTLAFFRAQNIHIIIRITIPLNMHTILTEVAVAMITGVEIDKSEGMSIILSTT